LPGLCVETLKKLKEEGRESKDGSTKKGKNKKQRGGLTDSLPVMIQESLAWLGGGGRGGRARGGERKSSPHQRLEGPGRSKEKKKRKNRYRKIGGPRPGYSLTNVRGTGGLVSGDTCFFEDSGKKKLGKKKEWANRGKSHRIARGSQYLRGENAQGGRSVFES